jgi:hypothetical protein
MRDEGPRYDPALAHKCIDWALELFNRKLGSGDLNAETDQSFQESRH